MSSNNSNDSITLTATEIADITNQIEQLQRQLHSLNIRLQTGTHRQQPDAASERANRRRRARRPIEVRDRVIITNTYGGNIGVTGEIESISTTRTTVVVLTFEEEGVERRRLRKNIHNVRRLRSNK